MNKPLLTFIVTRAYANPVKLIQRVAFYYLRFHFISCIKTWYKGCGMAAR